MTHIKPAADNPKTPVKRSFFLKRPSRIPVIYGVPLSGRLVLAILLLIAAVITGFFAPHPL